MPNDVENRIVSLEPSVTRNAGNGLVVTALVLPVIAGVVLCFVTTFEVSLVISAATVIVTAILLSVDAARLSKTDLNGRPREAISVLLLGMLLMRIVVYPLVIIRRRTFAAPNLTIPAIFVALFVVACPVVQYWLIPPGLPSCSSGEVSQILEGIIRGSPLGPKTRSTDGHREISYDSTVEVRQGQCVAHTTDGDVPVNIFVQWHDREKGLIAVRIPHPNLPSCTSEDVAKLLEQAIQRIPLGKIAQSLDGHLEVSSILSRTCDRANASHTRTMVMSSSGLSFNGAITKRACSKYEFRRRNYPPALVRMSCDCWKESFAKRPGARRRDRLMGIEKFAMTRSPSNDKASALLT